MLTPKHPRLIKRKNIVQIQRDFENLWHAYNPQLSLAPMEYGYPQTDNLQTELASMEQGNLQTINSQTRPLVFVGMNPSISLTGWASIIKKSPGVCGVPTVFNPHYFFAWPRPSNFCWNTAIRLEKAARQHYSFFETHRTLSKIMNREWDHLDLFAYRDTQQKNILSLVIDKSTTNGLTSFGESQFELFEELLFLVQPAAVIVVNALASRIYKQIRNPNFDAKFGCYLDQLTPGSCEFPVFFSGMLTGSRALDIFSRERLFWQVENVLNNRPINCP